LLQDAPLAIVCALSPWAIVAVILMLASRRPANAIWWTLGWTVSTFVTGAAVVLLLDETAPSGGRTHETAVCIVQLALAAGLAVAAAVAWRRRPARTGRAPVEPGWMERIGDLRPIMACALGAFWINSALVIAAATTTVRDDAPAAESLAACAVVAVISGSVQAAIIVAARLRPTQSSARLAGVRHWITRNQHVAAATVAILLAVWFGAKGVSGLAA
jgi:hypothetical protein